MLVLSRKKGESVQIGDDVVVTVLEIRGGHIRLGFSAPQTTAILRQEICNLVQKEASCEHPLVSY